MRRFVFALSLALMLALVECGTRQSTDSSGTAVPSKIVYSSDTSAEDCYLCGGSTESPLSPYWGQNNIALFSLNTFEIKMQLRGYSEHTQDLYGRAVGKFLKYSGKPVEALDEQDVRHYVLHLMNGDLSKGSINTYQAAIRFFFGVTLNRSMNYLQMPRLKENQTLPEILSREEMGRLLEHCENPKYRAMFALAYGSGLRVSEICALRVADIDSKQMRIFIRGGKGNKDRYTILSQQCLEFLRDYWRRFRPNHPEGLLFPGWKNISCITDKAINDALKKWLAVAGISRKVSIHSLRHGFATHLLEDGVDIFTIKELRCYYEL